MIVKCGAHGLTDCDYCRRPCREGQELLYDAETHQPCKDEWQTRYDDGKCVVCGKNERPSSESVCVSCFDNNVEYQGYQGP